MPEKRYDHSQSTLADGRVLVCGGRDDDRYLDSATIYNPTTDRWSPAARMPGKWSLHSQSTLADGRVL
eukprot:CAMPEP_0206309362 /NCGR_PEP_ID=MMETSP0106_2-20121207/12349_1 /ASSEMBLY_ACC=CAM_ASM_000206 /TAXON_ID=81532 /ORGANISM="Acanthoeca-like sp., Strain 10tr" /LENGTH=67 /DNA_ID=CAMNT_0053740457 /DNA_START=35 /DNA_END=235 /DNA_ORIENTATION=+